jgi:hypothetical protein
MRIRKKKNRRRSREGREAREGSPDLTEEL